MDYILNIIIFILIYAIAVQSLNLIMGYVGILSMAHAVFCAIGAYTAALISIHLGYNFLVGMAAGFILAGITGALLAMPSLRVQNEYLIVLTLGFQMVFFELLLTARGITQGQGGITGIPSPSLFGFNFDTPLKFLPLMLFLTIVCFAVVWRIVHSPFGRVLKAIREDESACRAIGKNTLKFKSLAFAVGGAIAAIAGSSTAYFISFVSPFSYDVHASVFLVVMIVMGGIANFWGPLLGALVLIGIPESLRYIPGTAGVIDAIREVFYGVILICFMLFRPQGILPEHSNSNRKLIIDPSLLKETNNQNSVNLDGKSIRKSTDKPIVTVSGLSKSFGGLNAVSDVSLELPYGQITGLIGPNGCGKTTLFNLITGHIIPDEGRVYVNDNEITNQTPYKIAAQGSLTRSWQDIRIFRGMKVLDNVMAACPRQSGENLFMLFFNPRKVAMEEQRNYRNAVKYLNLVGLLEKADQLATDLSTTEQKLVAIARILATECSVLLLDEPTAALDLDSVERIIMLIRNIAKQAGKTILIVEHNLDVVRGLVERAYFMSDGKILAYGKPLELMENPKLSEVYFGID